MLLKDISKTMHYFENWLIKGEKKSRFYHFEKQNKTNKPQTVPPGNEILDEAVSLYRNTSASK